MEYETALAKSWRELEGLADGNSYRVKFLADEYDIDIKYRRALSLSCNAPAQPFVAILLLHYLRRRLAGLPPSAGRWISFRELPGGEGYYPAFKKRVIRRIEKKYGAAPDAFCESAWRLGGAGSDLADAAARIELFDGVPVLVELWRADEEFGPSAGMLFDESVKEIFCTEDIVVMSEFLASQI